MAKDQAADVAVVDPNVTARDTALQGEEPGGVTPGSLYGDGAKPPDKPPAEPDKPPDKPVADTKAKVKPKPDKPPAEPDAAAVAAAKQEKWDADRQRSDQDHASERRALQGQVEATREQVTALQAQLTAAAQAKPEDEDNKRRMASLERLEGQMAGLTGESEPGTVAGVMRTMGGLLADLMATPTPTSAVDVAQVQQILDRLKAIEIRTESLSAETAAWMSEEALEKLQKRYDSKYGAQHHNAALERARKTLAAAGYDAEHQPNSFETDLVLHNAYMAEAAGDKPPGTMPEGKAGALPGDPGSGGAATQFASGPPGTMQEVLEDMQKKGQVR